MRHFAYLLGFILFACAASAADEGWRPLFNGKDLTGWDTFMGQPNRAWEVPGMEKGTNGAYLEPLGLNRDPLKVFTAEMSDGEPAVHISGQGTGLMFTRELFTNYHLRVQMKWGEKRWGNATARRNGGLVYRIHTPPGAISGIWPRCAEFQVMENDIGDFYGIGSQGTATAVKQGNLWVFDPRGEPVVFFEKPPAGPNGNRCVRQEKMEKPSGEWNTLELICLDGASIYVVNGKVVNRLRETARVDGPEPVAVKAGQIGLQTELAECYFRKLEIRPIKEVPAEFAAH